MSPALVAGGLLMAGFVAALGCVGCAPADDLEPRAAWLSETLRDDNLVWFRRSPARVGDKLAKMASTPYRYFRGSLGQHLRDAVVPGGPAAQVALLPGPISGRAAAGVALVGDPHPENLGTFVHDGAMTVAFNDFDAATFGPFWFDVRRLALGFAVFAVSADHGLQFSKAGPGRAAEDDPVGARALAEEVARGYAVEVLRRAAGGADQRLRVGAAAGAVLNGLMRRAADRGASGVRFHDETVATPVGRRLAPREEVSAPYRSALVPVSAELRQQLAAALPDWQAHRAPWPGGSTHGWPALGEAGSSQAGQHKPTKEGANEGPWQLLDVGRRLGAGVSSVAAWRLYLLVQRGAEVRLIEARESSDPADIPGLNRPNPRPFTTNGERVVRQLRAAHGSAATTPFAGWMSLGTLSLRVRWRSSWQRGLRVAKLADRCRAGDYSATDLLTLANVAGRLLARAHLRAPTADGGAALADIAAALQGREDALVYDTVAAVAAYLPVVRADHLRLVAMLAQRGRTLGWQEGPSL